MYGTRFCGLIVLALLLLASPTWAQLVDPLDLNVPTARLPEWVDPADPDIGMEARYNAAQTWQEYDVTCTSAPCAVSTTTGLVTLPYTDVGAMSVCSAVTLTAPANVNCMVAAAPADTVLYFPTGTYTTTSTMIANRSNLVLRGADHTTRIERTNNGRSRDPDCDVNMAGASILSVCDTTWNTNGSIIWTAGFSKGDTVITVGETSSFPDNSWVMLDMNDNDTGCSLVDTTSATSLFSHWAKVVPGSQTPASGAGTITIDRPLNFDWDATGCAGDGTSPVWTGARPMNPISNIGIENMHLTTAASMTLCNERQHIDNLPIAGQDCNDLGYYTREHLGIENVVESWVVGVKISRSYEFLADQWFSARWWWQGNTYEEVGLNVKDLAMGKGTRASSDIVHENEICDDTTVCFQHQQGTSGIVVAYSYFDTYDINVDDNCFEAGSGTTYPARCEVEKPIFWHAYFGRHLLAEGNDLDGRISFGDVFWTRNGPYNTVYRNRNRLDGLTDDHCNASNAATISFDKFGDNPRPSPYVNIIGNTAIAFVARPTPGTGSCTNINAQEGLNYLIENLWLEKNAYRVMGGTKIGGPGAFYILDGSGNNATTSFGTAGGENDHAGSNVDTLTNELTSSPIALWGTETYPTSMYRSSAPSWWCQEACPWTHEGIGAFGDDFGGTLCMLPAEIRYNEINSLPNATCTPLAATAAPVITVNTITIDQGETLVLGDANLLSTDADTPDGTLAYTVTAVTNGFFAYGVAPGVPDTTFLQSEVTAGDIVFVHDDSANAPTYSIQVSDGTQQGGPDAGTVNFTLTPPPVDPPDPTPTPPVAGGGGGASGGFLGRGRTF